FRVYAGNETYREYAVTVKAALNTAAKITKFVIDGFPDREGISGSPQGDYYPITVTLPYGTALTNLKPLIQYEGKTLSPGSGVVRNFSLPVEYIVHAEDYDANAGTGHSARYKVTVKNDAADSIRGIFDFVITNYPNCRVAIGQNPRGDGKIPIVIQVPHALTTTDLLNMIPEITLASPTSRIDHYTAPRNTTPIPFSDQGNPQEAVYTVTAQDSSTQDYVVLIHRDVQYYYVKGSGSDVDPDTDNGGSETAPFKTLAHAVYQASRHADINHIFVIGELNNSTEAGAWEQATASDSGFQPSGGDAESVFNLIGTTDNDSDSPDYKTAVKTITITGVGSNAVLRGTTDKRVISITGGARLVFENITITGGNSSGNGGGVYISGNSNVKFSSCSITGNTAKLGGGVYIEDSNIDYDSEFTLMGGTISGNTATGSATALDTMGGGGGVYIKGNALFWLSSGSVSDNTASHGAGGGVLVNGNPHHDPDGHEDGFLMSGGSVSGNKAPNGIKPHGGGGVYVARGAFEMQGGEITGNSTNRQGGGVFVYWATSTTETARFTASGNSSITGNAGVGSSAAICNRGITEMRGNAQADKIYVWNNESAVAQSFTLAENARAGGVVLAHSASNSNVITIASPSSITGNSRIAIIDLEGHLNNSDKLSGTIAGDWLGKKLLVVSSGSPAIYIDRLPLGTFVGTATSNIAASYKISVSGSAGILVAK
ncbi:MAG: hypothetical protein LBP74_09775, partial [Treponema sp.]|nr:hypothetical protein [Treponema sp.]